jgi:hypothetical protein
LGYGEEHWKCVKEFAVGALPAIGAGLRWLRAWHLWVLEPGAELLHAHTTTMKAKAKKRPERPARQPAHCFS